MEKTACLEKIRELFIKLHKGHIWMRDHPDNVEQNEALMGRAKPIFKELEELGVHETFSAALLIFGSYITDYLVNQFDEKF